MLEQFQVQFIAYHIMNIFKATLKEDETIDEKNLLMEILAKLSLVPIERYEEIEKRIMSEIDIDKYKS